MNAKSSLRQNSAPSPKAIALHVLQALAAAQREGHRCTFEELSSELKVRRTDVRQALSSLHREGFVDVLKMRLTFAGFAIGQSLIGKRLVPLRAPSKVVIRAA